MLYFERGQARDKLTTQDMKEGLVSALRKLGFRKKVLLIPPDFTRFHSQAGILTRIAWEHFGESLTDILPAIGTHFPMTDEEIGEMYAGVPGGLFRVHDWRKGLVTLGEVPAEIVKREAEGKLDFSWPAQVDRLLIEGGYDLILSIGQVVPHEVVGMANYTKNIFVGTGGRDGINKSHFIGAVYGMERMMGRADNPVRRILNYAAEHFAGHLPIVYAHTVVSGEEGGGLAVRGLYIGDDARCFTKAAELSLQVNFQLLEQPLEKVVVYLDPGEFKSTWIGNKSIYRTRMAMADGGELIVLAPGLREFGEDPGIDAIIRKYGYVGTRRILELVEKNEDLQDNLGAAAHLIHGSTEGRFTVTYCPADLSREEIEKANFQYADLHAMTKRYDPRILKDGFNDLSGGERIFFISNPALGLWAFRDRFEGVH